MNKKCEKTGKISHPNKVAAQITSRKLKNKALNPYYCKACEGWHLGTSNKDYRIQQRIDQLLGK